MDPDTGLPLAFGKSAPKKRSINVDKKFDETKRPAATIAQASLSGTHATEDQEANTKDSSIEVPAAAPNDDEDGPAAAENDAELPISHEVVMRDHHKTVASLSLDPSGSRMVTGSYDFDCKLWDFGGMNASFKPFRSWECKEGHQVHDVRFSPSGNSVLVATGSNQAKLYDRDGLELAEFAKGDPYIRDLRHTDGHVAALTSVAWNHKNASLFVSASEDSTLRIWDITNKRKSKSVIVVKSKERGGRSKVTACAWSLDGRTIGAASQDGALHLWSANSNFARPNATVERAHTPGCTTSCVVFSSDGKQVATRGGDGTVKLWDTRALKKPLYTAADLPSLNPESNLAFSPDEQYILVGTAGVQAGVLDGPVEAEKMRSTDITSGGKLVILRREGLTVRTALEISPASVVCVAWHPKINQIITGSSDGSVHVLYSPLTSLRGVTTAVTRAPRVRSADGFAATASQGPIIAPHSLPMFKDDAADGSARAFGGKRKRERERHDSQKTMKPMPPVVGPGRGGRIGAAATQHVVQGLIRDNLRDQDPREALLKYATADASENQWTAAWTATQPKPIFDTRPEEDNDDSKEDKKG